MNTKRVLLAASALAALLAAPAAFSQGYYPGGYAPRAYYPYPWVYGPPYYRVPLYAPPPVYTRRYYMPPQPPAAVAYGQRQYQESQVTHARLEPQPTRVERTVLSARELFDFDKAQVHGTQPKLDEIAEMMKRDPEIELAITGYTDRIGADSYNEKLSQNRAQAVKDYLVEKGVGPERLIAAGQGSANPIVECDDSERADLIKCLEPNRRVEVEELMIEHQDPQG